MLEASTSGGKGWHLFEELGPDGRSQVPTSHSGPGWEGKELALAPGPKVFWRG